MFAERAKNEGANGRYPQWGQAGVVSCCQVVMSVQRSQKLASQAGAMGDWSDT